MNRRDFFRVTGLAALGAALGWKVRTEPVRINYAATKIHDITGFIYDIDFREAPLLSAIGRGELKPFKITDWPSHKYEWVEDTLITHDLPG